MQSFFNIRRWVSAWVRPPARQPWHVTFLKPEDAPQGWTVESVTFTEPAGLLLLQPTHTAQLFQPLESSGTLDAPQAVTLILHSA